VIEENAAAVLMREATDQVQKVVAPIKTLPKRSRTSPRRFRRRRAISKPKFAKSSAVRTNPS